MVDLPPDRSARGTPCIRCRSLSWAQVLLVSGVDHLRGHRYSLYQVSITSRPFAASSRHFAVFAPSFAASSRHFAVFAPLRGLPPCLSQESPQPLASFRRLPPGVVAAALRELPRAFSRSSRRSPSQASPRLPPGVVAAALRELPAGLPPGVVGLCKTSAGLGRDFRGVGK